MSIPIDAPLNGKSEFGQVFWEGVTEVVGQQEAAELFELTRPAAGLESWQPTDLPALQAALQARYGPRGSKGVALRLGRASFRYGFRRWGESYGLAAPAFRLQPLCQRIPAVLRSLADRVAERYGSSIQVSEDAASWYWRVESCPVCRQRSAAEPDCHMLAGLLQGTLAWAGGERYYGVNEVECSATGAPACLFRIEKKPID